MMNETSSLVLYDTNGIIYNPKLAAPALPIEPGCKTMKFLINKDNTIVVLNTKRATLLCQSDKGENPWYRFYQQGDCYFRTKWYRSDSLEFHIFNDLNELIMNAWCCVGTSITIKTFNLQEVDRVQEEKEGSVSTDNVYTGKRNIQFGNHGR